jgi:hypothetical protein
MLDGEAVQKNRDSLTILQFEGYKHCVSIKSMVLFTPFRVRFIFGGQVLSY